MELIFSIFMFCICASLTVFVIGGIIIPIIGYTLIGLFYFILGLCAIADLLTPKCFRF